jgi:hypothetical protein
MMKHDGVGAGRFISYPLFETFNAVLTSLVVEFEGKPKNALDAEAGLDGIKYATSALDYMLSRSESGCWPNEDTFRLLFRLLMAVKPSDIGDRAEDLLSKLEVCLYFAHSRKDSFEMSLSMYHRVLSCWLEAARDPSFTCAPERAWKLLEKLEIQSIPFLLSDRETQLPSTPTLYNIQLRPSRKTYRLVQRICLEAAKSEKGLDSAVKVAFRVYRQLLRRGMLAPDGSDDRILSQCIINIPQDDKRRVAIAKELQSLLGETNRSKDSGALLSTG